MRSGTDSKDNNILRAAKANRDLPSETSAVPCPAGEQPSPDAHTFLPLPGTGENLALIKERALASSISGIALTSMDARVLYVNNACIELWGASAPDECIGSPAACFWEDPEEIDQLISEVRKNGVWEGEARGRRKDGSVFDAHLRGELIRDVDGRPIGMLGTMLDITDRKRTKEALRRSEARFREMADLLPQSLYEADRHGILTFANRAAFTCFGYAPEDLCRGISMADLIVPEERQAALGSADRLLRGAAPSSHEYTALRKDGTTFPVIISSAPIMKDGHPEGFRGVIMDITERVRSEKQVRQSELKLRQIAETISEVVWISDSGGEILYVNQAYERIFGRSCESFYKARSFLEQIHSEDRDRAAPAFEDGAATGDFECRILRPDGSQRWVRTRTFPVIYEPGAARRVVGIMEDITDQKSADALRSRETEHLHALSLKLIEARESERKYIAGELHDEIGQLATVLKLGIDVLEPDQPVSEDRIFRLRTLADELIQQIRNLSLGLRPSMLDDFGLLPAIRWLCDRLLSQTGTVISLHHEGLLGRLPSEVEITAYRAVQEALTNVVRHAETDAAALQIINRNGSISIEVSDKGRGFDPGAGPAAGAGAGLSGMRERVHSLGGAMTISSAPGSGTTLRIVLPANLAERRQ